MKIRIAAEQVEAKCIDRYYNAKNQQRIAHLETLGGGIAYTLRAGRVPYVIEVYKENDTMPDRQYRIRRLTPRETWRLMDFTDEQFDKAKEAGVSDTQLYKQAGNSIVVGVLEQIMDNLYDAMPYLFDNLKVSSYFSGIGAFESALDRVYEKHEQQ